MLAYEHVQLSENLLLAAESEVALDPVHQRRDTQLVQPCHLVAAQRFQLQPRERGATPESKRFPEAFGSALELTVRHRSAGLGHDLLHHCGVELFWLEAQPIAPRSRRDGIVTLPREHPTQLRDIDVDRLARRRRRRFPPQVVDQALARDELVRVQEEDGEDETLLERPQRNRLALVEHFERPKDPEFHSLNCGFYRLASRIGRTPLIGS